MISVRDLAVRIADQMILSGVTFQIEKKEIAAVIGPNGSGKTTLIRAILGLLPITQGSVLVDGHPLKHCRHHVGYLPQRLSIDVQFPITVNEFLGLNLRKNEKKQIESKITEVGLTFEILTKRLGTLSGGQLQRVLIAQATMHNPLLLVLDEPATGIDIVGEKQFYELIQTQRDTHGTTVMLVSHDISVISQVVDKVICINKQLICYGPPKKALTPQTLFELYGHQEGAVYHHNH